MKASLRNFNVLLRFNYYINYKLEVKGFFNYIGTGLIGESQALIFVNTKILKWQTVFYNLTQICYLFWEQ